MTGVVVIVAVVVVVVVVAVFVSAVVPVVISSVSRLQPSGQISQLPLTWLPNSSVLVEHQSSLETSPPSLVHELKVEPRNENGKTQFFGG